MDDDHRDGGGGSSLIEKEKDAFGVDQEGEFTPVKIQEFLNAAPASAADTAAKDSNPAPGADVEASVSANAQAHGQNIN